MDIFLGLFIFPLTILILTGPVAGLVSISLIKSNNRRGVFRLWSALAIAAVLLGPVIAHTFASFFPGPGCILSALTFFFAPLTFVVARIRAGRLNESLDANARRLMLIAALLVPGLQIASPVVSFGYARACDRINAGRGTQIAAALDAYRQRTGSYPSSDVSSEADLRGLLTPDYLPSWPGPACNPPAALRGALFEEDGFSLYHCQNSPNQDVLLLAPLIGSDTSQTFNLLTREWDLGDAFDGYCP